MLRGLSKPPRQLANVGTLTSTTGEERGILLECRDLVKRYSASASAAVDHLSLDVQYGEFVTLLGSSGSGKTSTLMMVAGFETPSSGKVYLAGRDVTDLPSYRRNIGMVFQNYLLFPHLSVAQNIAFSLKMRHMSRQEITTRVDQALTLVELAGFGDRLPRQLSGGQQQRVALARSVVFGPQLLAMDEPLAALDEQLRRTLQEELRKLHRELGTAILYVTHDQHEAMSLSDRIVVMRDGVAEESGTPEALYSRPSKGYTAHFMGEASFLPGTVLEDSPTDGPKKVRLHSTGDVLDIAGSVSIAKGDSVEVMIRPAALTLAGPAESSKPTVPHELEVRFVDASYVGGGVRLVGVTQSGERIQAVSSPDQVPQLGIACRLVIDPQLCWCVPSPPAAADEALPQGPKASATST
jgi:putative spermidine/putrescine transport system ATP-binding protein